MMERPPGYTPMIRDLPAGLRPRERMLSDGPRALSDAELLAIILRVGSKGENVISLAQRILSSMGGLAGMARASFEELCREHGVGEAKATQIKAALEFGRRLHLASGEARVKVGGPGDVAALLQVEMGLLDREELRVVLLDTKNFIHRIPTVYSGSLNTAVVRVGEIFREAIRANCASIILVHNHPSGDPTPSPEDVRMTETVVQAGRLLDIEVLDHVIIGRHSWASLKERGLGFR